MLKIDLNIINKAVEEKWVTKRDHKTLPLSIYTYSKRTEIDNNWNDITKMCRGLILDNLGNIVANPFPKFFNIGEQSKEKICGTKLLKHSLGNFYIPDSNYRIYDKMDGSLIQIVNYKGNIVISSKGSFESEQALRAESLLQKYGKVHFAEGLTYIFELIVPENRIVVDYKDQEELYLLGIRDNTLSKDLYYFECGLFTEKFGFKRAKLFNHTIEQCLDEINSDFDNREGYVVHFNDGNKLKIKFSSYMQLHKIMTDITSKDILDSISKGETIVDFCTDKNVPDEMIDEIKSIENFYISEYETMEDKASSFYEQVKKLTDRKEQAIYINTSIPKELKGIVFAMLDQKDYSKNIFSILKDYEQKNRKFIGTCAK